MKFSFELKLIDCMPVMSSLTHTNQPTHIHELNMQKIVNSSVFDDKLTKQKKSPFFFLLSLFTVLLLIFLSISRMKPTEINLMQNFYTYYLLMRLEVSTFTTLRDVTLCSIDKWPSLYVFFVNVFFRAIFDPILYFKRMNFYSISNVLM